MQPSSEESSKHSKVLITTSIALHFLVKRRDLASDSRNPSIDWNEMKKLQNYLRVTTLFVLDG